MLLRCVRGSYRAWIRRRLRVPCQALPLGPARGDGAPTLRDLACSGNHSQSYRGAKNLKVVVIDLVLQTFLSDLIEALELVEIDGITVRHNQAVKNHGHPPLLAEACGSNLLCFA